MNILRSIKVRFSTNYTSQLDLIKDFSEGVFNIISPERTYVTLDDNEESNEDFKEFSNLEALREAFLINEHNLQHNSLLIWSLDYKDSLSFVIYRLDEPVKGYLSHFEVYVSGDFAKRLEGNPNITDFSYYLNVIASKFTAMECNICETECHDFEQ